MGGKSSKAQITRFYMSQWWGLAMKLDAVLRVEYGEKEAWSGRITSTQAVTISKTNLYGGDKKEGGLAGRMTVLMGDDAQVLPDAIAQRVAQTTGANFPGARGVTSLFFSDGDGHKGFYWAANSPYLKQLAVTVERIPRQLDPLTAEIPRFGHPGPGSGVPSDVGFMFDRGATYSGSTFPRSAATTWGVPYTDSPVTYWFWAPNTSGLGRAKLWSGPGESDSTTATALVEKGLRPGQYAALAFNNSSIEAVTITTANVAPYSPPGYAWSFQTSFYHPAVGTAYLWRQSLYTYAGEVGPSTLVLDANPAHIIYECLTDTSWGLGEPPSNIDVVSFQDAARTLFAEQFGLSLVWDAMSAIEDFVNLILSHINAALFTDPATGLLKLKLVRDDYDRDTVREVNPDNARLTKFSRKAWGDTVNEIQVSWTDPADEDASKVVLQDDGNIAQQGSVSSSNSDYPGVRRLDLAWRLAERDLRVASAPLSTGEAEANRMFFDAEPMEVVKLHWPEYGIESVYARITSVTYGGLGASAISLALAEDVFSYTLAEYTGTQGSLWEPVVPGGAEVTGAYIMPSPYYGLAASLGVTTAIVLPPTTYATPLATADIGAAATYDLYSEVTLPNGATQYELVEGGRPFMAKATLPGELIGQAVSTISGLPFRTNDVLIIGAPTLGADKQELALVAAVDVTTGAATIWRAIGDTTPKAWPAGTEVWFGPGENLTADTTERVEGAAAKYKFFPLAADGDVDDRPVVSATMVARASRPYPPANVKINGVDAFSVTSVTGSFEVTWAHRNKETQAEQILKQDDASVAPPADVRYGLTLLNAANAVLVSRTDIGESSATVSLDYTGTVTLKLWSIGDEGDSFQAQARTFAYAPSGSAEPGGGSGIEAGGYLEERVFERPYVDALAKINVFKFPYRTPGSGYVVGLVSGVPGAYGAAQDFAMWTDDGSGYALALGGSGKSCPTAVLREPIKGNQRVGIKFRAPVRLDEVAIGSICLIGDELCRVDAINTTDGTVSLGRGCADTVPAAHAAGTRIFFYGATFNLAYDTEYSAGEVLQVKISTKPQDEATPHPLTMSRRLDRPYPPAMVSINGLSIFEVGTPPADGPVEPPPAGGPVVTPEGVPASAALGPNGGFPDDAPYALPLPPHSPTTSLIPDGDFDNPGALSNWTVSTGAALGPAWTLEPDDLGSGSMRAHYVGTGSDIYCPACTYRLPSQPLPRYRLEVIGSTLTDPGTLSSVGFAVGKTTESTKTLDFIGPYHPTGSMLPIYREFLETRTAVEIAPTGQHVARFLTPMAFFKKEINLGVPANFWFDECHLYATKIEPASTVQTLSYLNFDSGLTGWTKSPATGAGSPTLTAVGGVLALSPAGTQRNWQNVVCNDPITLADTVGKYVGITADYWCDDPSSADGVTQNGVTLGIIARDTTTGKYTSGPILGGSFQRGDFTPREVWVRVPNITGVTWHLCVSLRASIGKSAKVRGINVRVTDGVVD